MQGYQKVVASTASNSLQILVALVVSRTYDYDGGDDDDGFRSSRAAAEVGSARFRCYYTTARAMLLRYCWQDPVKQGSFATCF